MIGFQLNQYLHLEINKTSHVDICPNQTKLMEKILDRHKQNVSYANDLKADYPEMTGTSWSGLLSTITF